MKSFIRLFAFLVFASAFSYLLYYRVANPKVTVVANPGPIVRAETVLQRALTMVETSDEPFAREMEGLDRFYNDVRHLIRNGEYGELEALYEEI